MRSRFMLEDPKNIEATMKITMPLRQWEELRSQLQDKWPSSDLSSHINSLLSQGRKVFYADVDADD